MPWVLLLLPLPPSSLLTTLRYYIGEAEAQQMSEELTDVLVVLANQFLAARWHTLTSPEDWVVNKLMIEDQANTEESYSYATLVSVIKRRSMDFMTILLGILMLLRRR